MDIYEILKLRASLSPKLVRNTYSHQPQKESSHVQQRQTDASSEDGMTNAKNHLSNSPGDPENSTVCRSTGMGGV